MSAQYKKFKNGQEFLKLVNDQVISVLITNKSVRVIATTNQLSVDDFHDDSRTTASNSKEFSKAMSRAQYEITKND